jgi:glycosyltransferase involved in cell wall biosynthesis
LPVLEAWANGVPVVVPAHGAFPEMIEDTGGGLLFAPHDVASLAEALRQLVQDPRLAAECGRRAQEAVHQRYHADLMAQRTIALYEEVRQWKARDEK